MTSIEVKLSGSKTKISEGSVLYVPTHGPAEVIEISEKEILGEKMVFITMRAKKDNMIISTPFDKMKNLGIRTIVSKEGAKKILNNVLNKPAKSAKGVWAKRIQEYEMKLCSGSIIFIAEVVRDLFAGMKDPNKSYGERVMYDKALESLVFEMSIALGVTLEEANKMIVDVLNANYKSSHTDIILDKDDIGDGDFDDEDIDDSDMEDDMKDVA